MQQQLGSVDVGEGWSEIQTEEDSEARGSIIGREVEDDEDVEGGDGAMVTEETLEGDDIEGLLRNI